MKDYIQYNIQERDNDRREIIIATFSEFGFEGFEETEETLNASVAKGLADTSEADAWLEAEGLAFEKILVPGQNWNAYWESNFSPVVVDDFAGIRAYFHEPAQGVLYDLVITPKMSFGTGHHATTRQMVAMMRMLPVKGSRVFDFGTGTGVLAILAEKMGAREVEAIDNDEWSISNARENIEANNCDKVNVSLSDTPDGILPADIVLANINKHIILKFLPALKNIVVAGGFLLLSGLLTDDEQDIDSAAVVLGFEKENRSDLNGWIALVFRNPVVQC